MGVWATYLLCGLGGCLASYFSAPHTHTVSLGASAAVFGLFAVAVLTKFKPTLRHLLEAVVLGTFVMKQLLNVSRSESSVGWSAGGTDQRCSRRLAWGEGLESAGRHGALLLGLDRMGMMFRFEAPGSTR